MLTSDARSALPAKIRAELRNRARKLSILSFDALRALPSRSTDRAQVDGTEVEFTTIREAQPNGSVLVLVRSAMPYLMGMRRDFTEGFFIWPDGRSRAVKERIGLEFFG